MDVTVTEEQVDFMNATLREAAERSGFLQRTINWYITRHRELLEQISAGMEREKKLQQRCTAIAAKAEEWKNLFSEALESYKQVEAQLTTMENEHAEQAMVAEEIERAEQAMDTEEISQPFHLASKHTAGEEGTLSPKDLQIKALQAELALMEKTQWGAEMDYECQSTSEHTIEVLREVTQRVLALTVDVEESQPGYKCGSPSTSIHRQPQELPEHLRYNALESRKFECFNNIRCAQVALSEATENWKKGLKAIVAMQIALRKDITDIIVGNKELDP